MHEVLVGMHERRHLVDQRRADRVGTLVGFGPVGFGVRVAGGEVGDGIDVVEGFSPTCIRWVGEVGCDEAGFILCRDQFQAGEFSFGGEADVEADDFGDLIEGDEATATSASESRPSDSAGKAQ